MFDPSPDPGGHKDSISREDGPTARVHDWSGVEFVEPGEVASEFPSESVEPLAVPGCTPAADAQAARRDRLRRAANASRQSLSNGLSRSGEAARRVWTAALGTARWQWAHIGARRRSVPVSAGSFVLGVAVGAAIVWGASRPSTTAAVVRTPPSQLVGPGHSDAHVSVTAPAAAVGSVGVGPQKRTPQISSAPPLSPAPPLTSSTRRVPFRGSLMVYSRPAGARVFLNGRGAGTTPLLLKNQRVGSGVVRLELNGYETWSSAVQVVTNTSTSVRADLRRTSDALER